VLLEAMACGTAVITATNTSLPEAGGDAALFVDAMKVSEITTAMQRVMTDDVLVKDMQAKGLKHAASFSWERSAEKLLGTFKRLS